MTIDDLKSKNAENQNKVEKENKPELSITNQPVRDFGNGMKEFSPEANGFEPAEVEVPESTKDQALRMLDEVVIPKKIAEMQAMNDAIDLAGGELTEEEFRETLGQGFITQQLHDGAGDINDDQTESKTTDTPKLENNKKSIDKEIEELERDLEMDDTNIKEFIQPNENKVKEEIIEANKPIDNKEDENTAYEDTSYKKYEEVTKCEFNDNKEELSEEDKDLKALEGEISDPNDFEEKLKKAISDAMAPVNKQLGIEGFVISKKPVNANNVISFPNTQKKVFKWALYSSKQPIAMTPFTADELTNISANSRDATTAISAFHTIYDHIASPKSKSFDSWAKSISFFDVNHLYMAIYGACFNDANYIPYSCPHCQSVLVTSNTNIMDMVKFKNDEAKKTFCSIMDMPFTEHMGNRYVTEVIPISQQYAVAIKEPSLYSAFIEIGNLDREFRDKYSDVLQIVMYIDNIYVIDRSKSPVELHPIMYKEYSNNEVKTFKSRIIQWAKIIRKLNSDEYNNIASAIMAIDKQDSIDAVTYKTPSTTCNNPKCKKEIPEEVQNARDLVFTRHQLGIYGRL